MKLASPTPSVSSCPGWWKRWTPHFDSAISLHVVNLQRSGNEFPSHFVANVFLYAVSERRSAKSDTALIVIELDVVGEEKKKTFRGRSDCRSQRERHRARQWLCLVRPEI